MSYTSSRSKGSDYSYTLLKIITAIAVFVGSMILGPYYVNGDQALYRKVYAGLSELNLVAGYAYYFHWLSSLEFVHFFLSWVASQFLDKDFFFSICNGVLAYATMSFFQKRKANVLVAMAIVLTNYYYYVLYFPAERLKFGFLFLTLSVLYLESPKRMYSFAVLSIVSHAQVTILYAAIVFKFFLDKLKRFVSTGNVQKNLLLILIVMLLPVALIFRQLLNKFLMYFSLRGLADLIRMLIFFVLALYYSPKRGETVAIFFVLLVATLMVGGDRMNMMGYFVFLYYAIKKNNGFNAGVLLTTLYFGYLSIGFVDKILQLGVGFD